jgi:hypothetical protein
MTSKRIVVCPICHKEIEVRSGFAHQTLSNHIKATHMEKVVSE